MREWLERVRVVLCRPSHPGNIGAAARAMKTMGIADLRLIAPERFPAPEAQWMATHADDVLASARVYAQLGDALSDCVTTFALSARTREWSPQVLDARAAAAVALERAASGPVAFVFGAESAGLTNEELFDCQFLVHIPTDPQSRSLNLAQAVQLIAYDWRQALGGFAVTPRTPDATHADAAAVQGLLAHWEEMLVGIGFLDPASPKKLLPRLNQLFNRARLTPEEVHILRGVARAVLERRR